MKSRAFRLDVGQTMSLAGIAAAAVLAVIVNVVGARHYRRWDVTEEKRYTLSPATETTLRGLSSNVDIWIMMAGGDPLEQSLRQLLVSYQAETPKLSLHYIDPDRDTVALEDLRKRFKIEAGRSAEGRVVTDAVAVVAQGEKHWFLTPSDMFQVSGGEETQASPREEQALTSAIRSVIGGGRSRLCFTTGHGEASLDDAGEGGLSTLRGILEKDNYDTASVDTTEPNAHEPFKGCRVVVIAAPRATFTREEEARLRTYLLQGEGEGGSLFLLAGPLEVRDDSPAFILDDALSPFGIGMEDDFVFERDPRFIIPETQGIRFIAQVKPHPVTEALVASAQGGTVRDPPRVIVHFARSLRHRAGDGGAVATDLLTSSDQSFSTKSIAGAAEWGDIPQKRDGDADGPRVLAMASERSKVSPSSPHGPRVLVVGTGSVLGGENWAVPLPARGAAFLVENGISWLASTPQVLDVPVRGGVTAALRITEASRLEIRRYVLFLMPLAVVLLGVVVGLWRRSTEGKT